MVEGVRKGKEVKAEKSTVSEKTKGKLKRRKEMREGKRGKGRREN